MKFGLIGWPLGHSISPFIHKELFNLLSMEGSYTLYPTPVEQLQSTVYKLTGQLDGFNITVPYKQEMMAFITQTDPSAKLYGGTNTVKVLPDGLSGCNTDIIGVRKAMSRVGLAFKGRVCILGSGATSSLMAIEAALCGCDITIAVRPESRERGIELCHQIYNKTQTTAKTVVLNELEGNFDLLANGTISGMFPNVEDCPVPLKFLGHVGGVFDAVFNPFETVLVKAAKALGLPATGGLSMLVWQAAAAQTYWHGKIFDPLGVDQIIEKSRIYIEQNFSG